VVIDWRALLAAHDGVETRPAVPDVDVRAAEAGLGVVVPVELRDLYAVSDGLFDHAGQWFVVWPLVEVVTRNQEAWTREPCVPSGADRVRR
jgi:cell wall assembly regulator SMI1